MLAHVRPQRSPLPVVLDRLHEEAGGELVVVNVDDGQQRLRDSTGPDLELDPGGDLLPGDAGHESRRRS